MKKALLVALLLAPLTAFAQKFGHFNSAEIMPLMPEYVSAKTEIENQAKQFDDDLKRLQDEFQKKLDEYQKEESKLLENVKQRRQTELQDLQQRIQNSYQDNQQELQKLQQEKMKIISDKLTTAIKEIGKAGGYVYIMDETAGIPYISETLSTDVTKEIKAKLNLK